MIRCRMIVAIAWLAIVPVMEARANPDPAIALDSLVYQSDLVIEGIGCSTRGGVDRLGAELLRRRLLDSHDRRSR